MIEVYDVNNTEIKKLMDEHNRSAAFVANALIEESLFAKKIIEKRSIKL